MSESMRKSKPFAENQAEHREADHAKRSNRGEAARFWRPGLMTCLIIGGLVLINAAVLLTGDTGDSQVMRRWIHSFNPWHWPAWYATNLWILFAGLTGALVMKQNRTQTLFHAIWASRFWQSGITQIKTSKPNQAMVRFFLRGRIGRWLLRKWMVFWRGLTMERLPVYVFRITVLAILFVFVRYADGMTPVRDYLRFLCLRPYHFLRYDVYDPYYLGPLVEYHISGTITWKLFIAPSTGLLLIVILLYFASQSRKKRRKTDDS